MRHSKEGHGWESLMLTKVDATQIFMLLDMLSIHGFETGASELAQELMRHSDRRQPSGLSGYQFATCRRQCVR